MTEFEKLMAAAKERKGGDFPELPLGKYIMKLEKAFHNVSKQGTGKHQANFDWVVMEPVDMTGERHRSFQNLENDVGLSIFIQTMEKLDIDVTDASDFKDFDAYLETVSDMQPVFAVTISKSGEYLNTRIGEFLGSGAETSTTEKASKKPKPEPEPETQVQLDVGTKIRYKYKEQTFKQKIKSVNSEKETVDTQFHHNIPLGDILELISSD